MAFEILVKKVEVEDTEAYQETMRLNNNLGFLQNFTICHFGLSPFFAKLLTEKVLLAIIHCSNAKTAINYHVEYERVQTT